MSGIETEAIITHDEPDLDLEVSEAFSGAASPQMGHPIGRRSRWWIASGLFLLVLAVYVLTSPGRIDIVDGQARYDAAYNWLVTGRPALRDNWVGPFMGVSGRDGLLYSFYGAPASFFSIPLIWVGLYAGAPSIQPSQFLFAMTSSVFGAAIAPILFLFYLELGATRRKALACTLVSSFASYIWAISNSTFDNAQHAFFALTAVYFGCLGARRKSVTYAVLGGLTAGVLFLYQEYFLLIIPALALSTLQWKSEDCSGGISPTADRGFIAAAIRRVTLFIREVWAGPGEPRSAFIRYFSFIAAVSVGILLSLAYNHLRFGSYMDNGKMRAIASHGYPLYGNPVAGFLTLLVSPGKSGFLYSPTLLLGVLGIRRLWRREPALATVIGLSSVILIGFLSCITFAGGDWCWGPRYLTPLIALWALAFPFAFVPSVRRELLVAIVGFGFLVQVLASSVENQRFFFEEKLDDYFWAEDSWAYFKRSALLTRVSEVASLSQGVPPTAKYFNSIPIPDWSTYCILGPPPRMSRQYGMQWMSQYQIYFVPRPWPLWMSWLPRPLRPVDIRMWLFGLLAVTLGGVGLIYRGIRKEDCT
jgi:hypothetical protein